MAGMALTDAQREKIKLRANYVNGMAVGTFTTGALSPIIAFAIRADSGDSHVQLSLLITVICFALSVALHLRATEALTELDR